MDTRYEVRDAQELAAGLVDDGRVDRLRIGAVGVSYGAAKALALAVLKDRKMLPDGSFVPWTTAQGAQIALAGAASTHRVDRPGCLTDPEWHDARLRR